MVAEKLKLLITVPKTRPEILLNLLEAKALGVS